MIFLFLALFARNAQASPADDIAAVVNHDLTSLRTCYDINAKPGTSGKILTRFTVGAVGKVTKAEIVNSDFKNEKLEACVIEALRALTFPAGGTALGVEYPFEFKPLLKAKPKKTKT